MYCFVFDFAKRLGEHIKNNLDEMQSWHREAAIIIDQNLSNR